MQETTTTRRPVPFPDDDEAERIHDIVTARYGPGYGYEVKTVGPIAEGPGGMLKEDAGKPCPTLIPTWFLWRLAAHMTRGAKKYQRNNWMRASSQRELDGFRDSAFRHLLQWLDGEKDEDHAAAIVANVFMAEATEEKLCSQSDPGSAASLGA